MTAKQDLLKITIRFKIQHKPCYGAWSHVIRGKHKICRDKEDKGLEHKISTLLTNKEHQNTVQ